MTRLADMGKHDAHWQLQAGRGLPLQIVHIVQTLMEFSYVLQISLQQGGFPVLQPIVAHGS